MFSSPEISNRAFGMRSGRENGRIQSCTSRPRTRATPAGAWRERVGQVTRDVFWDPRRCDDALALVAVLVEQRVRVRCEFDAGRRVLRVVFGDAGRTERQGTERSGGIRRALGQGRRTTDELRGRR